MSKTHAEFLAYVKTIESDHDVDDDVEKLLKMVVKIADKLKKDFQHLATHISECATKLEFIGRPVLDVTTVYYLKDFGDTEEDREVLESIFGIMQNYNLENAVLDRDDAQNARAIIKWDSVKRLKDLGYNVYIDAHIYDDTDEKPLPYVYLDLGELLVRF